MAVVIRKGVQHDESVLSPVQNQRLRIVRLARLDAKETAFGLGHLEVCHAPGRPDPFHTRVLRLALPLATWQQAAQFGIILSTQSWRPVDGAERPEDGP